MKTLNNLLLALRQIENFCRSSGGLLVLGLCLGGVSSLVMIKSADVTNQSVSLNAAQESLQQMKAELNSITQTVDEKVIRKLVEETIVKSTVVETTKGVDAASIAASVTQPIQAKVTELENKLTAVDLAPSTVAALAAPEMKQAISALSDFDPASIRDTIAKVSKLEELIAKLEKSDEGKSLLSVAEGIKSATGVDLTELKAQVADLVSTVAQIQAVKGTGSTITPKTADTLSKLNDSGIEALAKTVEAAQHVIETSKNVASTAALESRVSLMEEVVKSLQASLNNIRADDISVSKILDALQFVTTDNIKEGSRLYYTDARALLALKPTTDNLSASVSSLSGSVSSMVKILSSSQDQLSFNIGTVEFRTGKAIATIDGPETFTFPRPFTTGCISVQTTRNGAGSEFIIPVTMCDQNGFTINRSNDITGTNPFTYISIGY